MPSTLPHGPPYFTPTPSPPFFLFPPLSPLSFFSLPLHRAVLQEKKDSGWVLLLNCFGIHCTYTVGLDLFIFYFYFFAIVFVSCPLSREQSDLLWDCPFNFSFLILDWCIDFWCDFVHCDLWVSPPPSVGFPSALRGFPCDLWFCSL